jgi:hypothetical protein
MIVIARELLPKINPGAVHPNARQLLVVIKVGVID